MDDRTRNIIVGITTLAGLAGLIGMLLTFGNLRSWFQDGYGITVYLTDAGGLAPGSRVKLRGMDVGQVTEVELLEPVTEGVRVEAEINPEYLIPRGSSATLPMSLIGSTPQLLIVSDFMTAEALRDQRPDLVPFLDALDDAEDPEALAAARDALEGHYFVGYLPDDGSAVIRGKPSALFEQLGKQLGGTLENVAANTQQVAQDFNRLSGEWTAVGANIRTLTDARSTDAVDAGEAVGNIATVIARADQRLAEFKDVLASIEQYTNDEQLRDDLKTTLANARKVSDEATSLIDGLKQRIGTVQDTFTESIDAVSRRYVALANDFSEAVAPVRKMFSRAEQGEGTVGKMMQDPAVYDNLEDATSRLELLVDEARLLIEKWKTEGLPVQF